MQSPEVIRGLEQYDSAQKILKGAKNERWPYPKTFELLKEVGVESYIVGFVSGYDASYYGIDGGLLYKEEQPEGYHNIQAAKQFSAAGVKDAIVRNMRDKTPFLDFLKDIANAGSSHYIVSMDERTVTYYNDSESQCHVEQVPAWDWNQK